MSNFASELQRVGQWAKPSSALVSRITARNAGAQQRCAERKMIDDGIAVPIGLHAGNDLYVHPVTSTYCVRHGAATTQVFLDSIRVRASYNDPTGLVDAADGYADHYVMYGDAGETLAAIRVIRRQLGKFDFDADAIIANIALAPERFGSANRLVLLEKARRIKDVLKIFVGVVWNHQRQYCDCDLMNCRPELVPIYRRMGYSLVDGASILHPRTGAVHPVMIGYVDNISPLRSYREGKFEGTVTFQTIEAPTIRPEAI
jgi:hypothetical protein